MPYSMLRLSDISSNSVQQNITCFMCTDCYSAMVLLLFCVALRQHAAQEFTLKQPRYTTMVEPIG